MSDDTLAITSTVAAALQALDQRDAERLATLWAADARLRDTGADGTTREIRGRDAILAAAAAAEDVARFMIDAEVRRDGDGAEVRYRLFLAEKGAAPGAPRARECRDHLRRIDGGWRIVEHEARPFAGDPMAHLDALAANIGA
jgi:hypothetical protein